MEEEPLGIIYKDLFSLTKVYRDSVILCLSVKTVCHLMGTIYIYA